MSIATLAEWLRLGTVPYFNRVVANDFVLIEYNAQAIGGTNGLSCGWSAHGPTAGAAPTTAAVPTINTSGCINQLPLVNKQYLVGMDMAQQSTAVPYLFGFWDRLSHQGGLNATLTTAQTTNLPTAALPRHTSGEGVHAFLQIYTQLGTTATTFTVSYTNQAGTAGRTSQPAIIGGTGYREVGRLLPINLADGDTGIRSVESVTLLASTVTAGNFGVVLMRPKWVISYLMNYRTQYTDSLLGTGGFCEPITEADSGICVVATFVPIGQRTLHIVDTP